MVISSFKSKPELAQSILSLPQSFSYMENFSAAMKTINFWTLLRNTIVCTFPSVALVVLASSMGGYAIAKHGEESRIIKGMDMSVSYTHLPRLFSPRLISSMAMTKSPKMCIRDRRPR